MWEGRALVHFTDCWWPDKGPIWILHYLLALSAQENAWRTRKDALREIKTFNILKIQYFHSRMGGKTLQAAVSRCMAHGLCHSKHKKIWCWLIERMEWYWKVSMRMLIEWWMMYVSCIPSASSEVFFWYFHIPSINELQIFLCLLWYTPCVLHRNTGTWKGLPPILEWKYRIFNTLKLLIIWSMTICIFHTSIWAECGNI